jgi:hypothetical protein
MKHTIINTSALFLFIALLAGCQKSEDLAPPAPSQVAIEFKSAQLSLSENEPTRTVELLLNSPAVKDGTVKLSLDSINQTRFTTEPALVNGQINLSISKNQESVAFKIKPVNTPVAEGNRTMIMTLLQPSEGFRLGQKKSLSLTIIDDDTTGNNQAKSVANFIGQDANISEKNQQGQVFTIQFSRPLAANGSLEITVESPAAVYGTHFTTNPAAVNGRIGLTPAIGSQNVHITVVPINNSTINGDLDINFSIINTGGSIQKGTQLNQTIKISDDELANKPKGYMTSGGGWGLKKIYEYNETGKVKRVHIESSTPATSSRTETYFYNSHGQITKINTHPQIDVVFTWANGKIIKSETIDHGIMDQYTLFEYDNFGNVSGAANYYKQPNGQFKLGSLMGYLYFADGNLYKSLYYIPKEGSEDYTLISTRTYEGYIDAENPFPLVEIIPGIKSQHKLPTQYRIEENGADLNYKFTYEFRPDGLVSKRITTGGQGSETASYLYY